MLPIYHTITRFVLSVKTKIQTTIYEKISNKYRLAVAVDLACIALILLFSFSSPLSLLSPLAKSAFSAEYITTFKGTHEVFIFAPGWSFNKLNKIQFEEINTVAYFDLPINPDGTLNIENSGYETFMSEEFSTLLTKAHSHNVKVLLTISQTNNQSIIKLLDNPDSQQTLINEAIAAVKTSGADGVVLDLEYKGAAHAIYQKKLNTLMDNLTTSFHKEMPLSQVSIALPGSLARGSIYDMSTLAQHSDRVFLIAYDYAVPESLDDKLIAPQYGYKDQEYWNTVLGSIEDLLEYVPANKLALETAWYGNGENYPLYTTNYRDNFTNNEGSEQLTLRAIEKMISGVPREARPAARKNLPLIAQALKKEGILNANVLAYALATIEHETAGTFEPIEEYGGRKSARRLGYEGGTHYFGRGFIQLTHLRNYKLIGERIGLGDKLVKNPSLALDPEISAQILAAYFKDNGIARLASNGNFVAARTPINPDNNGWWVASLANKYLDWLYI